VPVPLVQMAKSPKASMHTPRGGGIQLRDQQHKVARAFAKKKRLLNMRDMRAATGSSAAVKASMAKCDAQLKAEESALVKMAVKVCCDSSADSAARLFIDAVKDSMAALTTPAAKAAMIESVCDELREATFVYDPNFCEDCGAIMTAAYAPTADNDFLGMHCSDECDWDTYDLDDEESPYFYRGVCCAKCDGMEFGPFDERRKCLGKCKCQCCGAGAAAVEAVVAPATD